MPYETFVVDPDGAVATVRFNRPLILIADAYLGAGGADGEDAAETIVLSVKGAPGATGMVDAP
jgi:hypothetical protein